MLPFSPQPSVFQTAKCFFSHGTIGHIDPAQPPAIESTPSSNSSSASVLVSGAQSHARRLKKPWSSIQALGFVSQLSLILPQDCADVVRQKLAEREPAATARPQFARVVMTLGQVLEGAFFKEYVKAGNVLMLSEGRPGQDDVFTLKGGRLTMFLRRETYDRAGLVGKPYGAKGGRGLRPRWVVEFDLNGKAMWPGKSGFDRLIYACKSVFQTPLTWLFCNMFDAPNPDPLSAFAPKIGTVTPTITEHINVALPPMGRPASLLVDGGAGSDRLETEETVVELYEWFSLVRLGSPRVQASDSIDPYLSRYQVPGTLDDQVTPTNICTLSWNGFLSPTWACQTLLDVLLAMPSSKAWFSLSVSSFASSAGLAGDGAECTFFRPADAPQEFLLWDVHSHE